MYIYIHNTINTHIYTDAYAQVYTTLKHSNLSIFIKYLNVFIIYYGIYLLSIFIYIYVYTHIHIHRNITITCNYYKPSVR